MRWLKEIDRKSKLAAGLLVFVAVAIYILFKATDHADTVLAWIKDTTHWVSVVLKPVIIGFIVAYLLFPIVHRLELLLTKVEFFRRKPNLTKIVSITIVALGIVGLVALFICILVSIVKDTVSVISTGSIVDTLREYANTLTNISDQLTDKLHSLNIESEDVNNWADNIGDYASSKIMWLATFVISLISKLPSIFTTLLFSIIFGVYFLYDGEGILIYWRKILRALLGKKMYGYFKRGAADADRVFSGYIRGQATDATFVAVVVCIVFSLFKIKYAILIGVLTGVGNLVPYLGPVLGYGSILITSVITGDFKSMVLALILMLIVQTVDGNIINPKFLSDAIKVHPLLVVLSLIVGGKIGGFLGMLLAVPCGALLKIWFERGVYTIEARRRRREAEEQSSDKDNDDQANLMEEVEKLQKELTEPVVNPEPKVPKKKRRRK